MSIFKWPDRSEGKDMWIKLLRKRDGGAESRQTLAAARPCHSKAQGIPSLRVFPHQPEIDTSNVRLSLFCSALCLDTFPGRERSVNPVPR